MENIGLLTAKEIEEKMAQIKSDFEDCKERLKEGYQQLISLNGEYLQLQEELNRRNGVE